MREGDGAVSLMTHPDHLRLTAEMNDQVEGECRSRGRASLCALNNDAWLQAQLRFRGYRVTESGWFVRKYDASLTPHHWPIPEGFKIIDFASYRVDEERIRAVSSAFGRSTIDREWYGSIFRAPGRSPRWVISVISTDGRCASFAVVRRGAGYAKIDPIGTHPDHQRKGLAKACLAECFRHLRRDGKMHAYYGSVPEPAPSNRLCDSLRPVEFFEELVWERSFRELERPHIGH